MKPEFVHHHVHGYYSLLDGLASPEQIARTVKSLGMPGWSMTDHGSLASAFEATQAAKKYDLKVNIGCELYFTENRHLHQTDRYDQRYYHLLAIATNMTGYRNLMKMQTIGHYEGYYFKPRVDFETLEKYGEGIIFTTACLGGHVNQALLNNDYQEAMNRLGLLTDAVGRDNVYVEIQDQNLREEKRILPMQAQLAKDMGLPLLPTGDCHYAEPTDYDFHDSLLCSSTNAKKIDVSRFKFDSDQFYIMSPQEMHKKFGDQHLYPNAMQNTLELMDRCDFTLATGSEAGHIMPKIEVPKGETEDTILRKRVYEGAKNPKRYGDGHGNIPDEVRERIDYELSVVEKMGFAGYFLIVSDLIEMFHENDIEVGPGRGCLIGETPVWTPDGYKNIMLIKEGDKVLTHRGRVSEVAKTFTYRINESTVKISTDTGSVTMTGDHKVLVSKYNGECFEKPEWLAAEYITEEHYVCVPRFFMNEDTTLDIPFLDLQRTGYLETIGREESHLLMTESWNRGVYATSGHNIVTAHPSVGDGDHIFLPVRTVDYLENREQNVYDLSVPGDTSFMTDSFLVHNSAPGSVAVYCLGITNIDPMSMGLFFERFLNPDRISFPDIDIDIPKNLRPKALKLLQERYGEENVAHIANINRMDTRTAISRASKVYGLSFSEEMVLKDIVVGDTNKGDAHVPGLMEEKNMSLKEVVDGVKAGILPGNYLSRIRSINNAEKILETALSFVGVVFAEGIHACGIVIMPEPVDHYFPIRKSKKAQLPVTQFDKDGIEETGGVKMDLLGLETLDECEQAERNILLDLGEKVDSSNLTPDDKDVYKMLSKGEGSGVFQLACLSGDTMIDGISIRERSENQRLNRYLRSVNLAENKVERNLCHAVVEAGVKPSVKLTTRNGRSLTMTPEHKVFTSRGWLEASKIVPHLDNILAVPGDPTIESPYNRAGGMTREEGVTLFQKMNPTYRRWATNDEGFNPDLISADGSRAIHVYREYESEKMAANKASFDKRYPDVELRLYYTNDIVEASYETMHRYQTTPVETVWDQVVSLEHGEDMMMYDVIMSNPVRNFIANNLMVHNSGGMKNLLKEMKPENIFDLSALVALYRPGPLGMGTHIEYCKRKNGEVPMNEGLVHPDMEELLKDTYGLVCYQEDVMNLGVHFGGYTGAEADHLRKATAKKIPEMMAEEKNKFVPAVNARNGGNLGEKLWEIIEPFSEYAFNRSHSAAYAVISYRTAWLKYHYPAQYGAALLDNAGEKNKEKRKDYLSWMKRWGLTIYPPNVNSREKRTVTTKDTVTLSPMFMSGIGDNLIDRIVEERNSNGPFTSIVNFLSRVKVSENYVITMIKAGYFDELHKSRRAMLLNLDRIMKMSGEQRSYDTVQDGLFGDVIESSDIDLSSTLELDEEPEVSVIVVGEEVLDDTNSSNADLEEQVLSIVCGKHPYMEYEDIFLDKAATTRYRGATPISTISDKSGKSWFYGIITSVSVKQRSRDGSNFLILTISDDIADIKALSFKEVNPNFNPNTFKGRAVMVYGDIKHEEGRGSTLFVDRMSGIKA